MPIIAIEPKKISDVVLTELNPDLGQCRDVFSYSGAAKSFAVGDLITAVGGVPAAAANIEGIVLEAVSAPLNVATKIVVLDVSTVCPAVVKSGGLVLGALTLGNVIAQLKTKGTKVVTTV
jgi:hypothetical protein